MTRTWTNGELLELAAGFQATAVLAAAADLDLFAAFKGEPATAGALAGALACDRRALTVLLDALTALELVEKNGEQYSLPSSVAGALGRSGPGSVRAMAQHQANCMRRWARAAEAVQSGTRPAVAPSIRGEAGDLESFIQAMNDISAPMAPGVIADLAPLVRCTHLLDVGGGSGTWAAAWLEAFPEARATIFDRPEVIPMARERIRELGLSARVDLAGGDYLVDPLPGGADLAWISAIIHQLSREEMRALFAAAHRALAPGGRVLIRDIVMDETRTRPRRGALFAVNMLVGTDGGGTYTLGEIRAGLEAAGFSGVTLLRPDEGMNAVVAAEA